MSLEIKAPMVFILRMRLHLENFQFLLPLLIVSPTQLKSFNQIQSRIRSFVSTCLFLLLELVEAVFFIYYRYIKWLNLGFTFSETTSEFPNGTMVPVYDNNNHNDISDGCKDLSPHASDYKNKILLLKRGKCTFTEKLESAKKVGAIGVIFYETDPTIKAITVADTKKVKDLPMLGIDNDDGLELKEYFKAKKAAIEITFPLKMVTYKLETGGTLSEFSSIGPTYELDLKPTLAGIGGEVFSTVPLAVDDGWGVKTGTSMASPHVAGVSALMIEHYRRTNASSANGLFIIEHLQNHAKLVKLNGRPDHPIAQGAGLVQRKFIYIQTKSFFFYQEIHFKLFRF